MSNLPQTPSLQSYSQTPIQSFGINLLQTMGYNENRGIGKKPKNQLTDILVLKPRPKGLGLGAEQPEDEKEKEVLEIGDRVLVVGDVHKGLVGVVAGLYEDQTYVDVQLQPSLSKVKIQATQLKRITKSQMQKHQKQQQLQPQPNPKKTPKLKWITPHIKIKITNPKHKLYLHKLTVTDILSKREFQCRDQKGITYTDLTQQDVQTVIPKVGHTVLILRGQYKGEKAMLMERRKGKGEAVVQTVDGLEVVKVEDDYVAEFVEL